MLLTRRTALAGAGCMAFGRPAFAAQWPRVVGATLDRLADSAVHAGICGPELAALIASRKRMARMDPPEKGRFLLVNVPAQTLTAFSDGDIIFVQRAAVGAVDTPTPEMETSVLTIRMNPAYKVPSSIASQPGWRSALDDPASRKRLGLRVDPDGTVWQDGGEGNPLGGIKVAFAESAWLCLGGTDDTSAFGQEDRACTDGRVRVEDPDALAAWLLDANTEVVRRMREGGDVHEYKPVSYVPVSLAYLTALPDGDGTPQFYPDIYGKDAAVRKCAE